MNAKLRRHMMTRYGIGYTGTLDAKKMCSEVIIS